MQTWALVLAADDAGEEESPSSGGFVQLLFPFVIVFVIFWLLLIRPQQKADARHRELLKNIKRNDRVVTEGGIIGTVVQVKDDEVVLRVDDQTKTRLRIIPSKIVGFLREKEEAAKEGEKEGEKEKEAEKEA